MFGNSYCFLIDANNGREGLSQLPLYTAASIYLPRPVLMRAAAESRWLRKAEFSFLFGIMSKEIAFRSLCLWSC